MLSAHLGANALCAPWRECSLRILVVRTPGYDAHRLPRTWDLTLFYVARPRISWLFLGALSTVGRDKDSVEIEDGY